VGISGNLWPDSVDYINRLDDFHYSAFDYAMRSSLVIIIDILVRSRAGLDRRDLFGLTPLMDACHLERDEVIESLIDYGADVTATDNFNQSILEHIMIGESRMKHSLL
jgi:ankyrin repeat protein